LAYQIYLADCLEWAAGQPENSVQTIVTDPPFGFKEYTAAELCKLRAGRGSVWRIPPSFDGSSRRPLPRFTVLTGQDLQALSSFFLEWGQKMRRI
jgi:tRNA G10  N-methylase Trm11